MIRSSRFLLMTTVLSAAVLAAGCSHGSDSDQAKQLAQGITQTMASGQIATSKACKLLTPEEVSAVLGATVDAGHDWNIGCEWRAGDKAVQVVVARANDWEPMAKSAGGESVPGVGKEAFVGPELGSFKAGALTDTKTVYVSAPTREMAVRLLRKAVEQLPAN